MLTRWHLLWKWLQLRRTANLPRAAVERRRQRQFAKLLAYVNKHSAYYRRIITQRQLDLQTATPDDFPVLTKPDLIEHFDEIVTTPAVTRQRVQEFLSSSRDPNELLDRRYVIVHTSGTTGEMGVVAYTKKEWIYGWLQFSRICPGVFPPRRTAFVGATGGHFAGATLTRATTWLSAGICGDVRLLDVNLPWSTILQQLNDYQPVLLSSYGSTLAELSTAQQQGQLHIHPQRIACSGDALPAAECQRVREVFGVPVFNLYATTETMIAGLVEEGTGAMVLFEDDLWIDFQEDHLLVTNLLNWTTPLIRYKISDVIRPLASENPAPPRFRGFRRAQSLITRNEHQLPLINEEGREDAIHPIVIAEFFCQGVQAFQVQWGGPAEFVFCVVPEGQPSPAEQAILERNIRQRWDQILATKRMRNVRYAIRFADHLQVDPQSRKFRLVDLGTRRRAA